MTIRPDKRFLSVLKVRLCLCAILPIFICGVLSTFFWLAAVIAAAVIISLFLFTWIWYLPRYYRSCRVVLSADAVAVCRGVFLRKKYILPSPRTIYCDEMRSPVLSLFGLKAINVHLVRRTLSVDGLSSTDANLLLSHISGEGAHE